LQSFEGFSISDNEKTRMMFDSDSALRTKYKDAMDKKAMEEKKQKFKDF